MSTASQDGNMCTDSEKGCRWKHTHKYTHTHSHICCVNLFTSNNILIFVSWIHPVRIHWILSNASYHVSECFSLFCCCFHSTNNSHAAPASDRQGAKLLFYLKTSTNTYALLFEGNLRAFTNRCKKIYILQIRICKVYKSIRTYKYSNVTIFLFICVYKMS